MMMLKDSRQKRVREGRKKNKLENVFFCFFWHGHGLFSLNKDMLSLEVEYLGGYLPELLSSVPPALKDTPRWSFPL